MGVIFYVYYETDQCCFNLDYFVNFGGILPQHDYIFIINGKTCSIKIPFGNNIHIIYNENVGYDFGGFEQGISFFFNNPKSPFRKKNKVYNFFVFMNASVIGPITHHSIQWDWVEYFRHLFIEDPSVRLYGTSIVCLPEEDEGTRGPKVEGFFWCTDLKGLDLLIKEETIFMKHPTKESAIINGEYGLSNCLLGKHGFNIGCILTRYQGIDWRNKMNWSHNECKHPSRKGTFYGESMNPYETIFHKWFWHNEPTVHKELIDKHIERKQIERKQIEQKQIEQNQIEQKQIEQKQMERKQMERKQMERKQIEQRQKLNLKKR